MALPVFALLILAEVLYTRSQGRNAYALKDFAGSMSQLGINSLVRLAIGGALISLHFFLYQFRVFEVPNTAFGAGSSLLSSSTLFSIGITGRSTGCGLCGVPTWCITRVST